jgi:hypothetical protein
MVAITGKISVGVKATITILAMSLGLLIPKGLSTTSVIKHRPTTREFQSCTAFSTAIFLES